MSYEKLDEAIIAAIRGGADRFYLINAAVKEHAKPHSLSDDPYRVVDRRIQALRKRRLITHWAGKWRIGNDR